MGFGNSVAVFHPGMGFGGSEAATMWTLQALKQHYRVALIAGGRIDLSRLNSFCGTSIKPSECELLEIPVPWPLSRAEWGDALRGALVNRGMRRYFERFDVLISSYNIGGFSRPGIHLLADFSWDEELRNRLDPKPQGVRGFAHLSPRLRHGYLALVRAVGGTKHISGSRGSGLVIANSRWSRDVLFNRHGIESRILYPPVHMKVTPAPPELKLRQFVCLGRISPEKRIERMIDILKKVRSRGHDLQLHIVGDMNSSYGRQIAQNCYREGAWIKLDGHQIGASRDRLLAESAFGIHARTEEPFGIAVAEMLAAGCVPFVPAQGGPAEIVDNHAGLTYSTVDDAAEKIHAMLLNRVLEREARASMSRRARVFSTASYEAGIREIVGGFLESQSRDFAGAAR
jgi:glycosyltransferase involved in cell wall biosynthesis